MDAHNVCSQRGQFSAEVVAISCRNRGRAIAAWRVTSPPGLGVLEKLEGGERRQLRE